MESKTLSLYHILTLQQCLLDNVQCLIQKQKQQDQEFFYSKVTLMIKGLADSWMSGRVIWLNSFLSK